MLSFVAHVDDIFLTFLTSMHEGGQKPTKVDRKVDRKGGQKTRDAILSLIRSDNNITSTQMAERIGINRSAVSKHLKSMQQSGIIRRVGPDKGGHWEISPLP